MPLLDPIAQVLDVKRKAGKPIADVPTALSPEDTWNRLLVTLDPVERYAAACGYASSRTDLHMEGTPTFAGQVTALGEIGVATIATLIQMVGPSATRKVFAELHDAALAGRASDIPAALELVHQ